MPFAYRFACTGCGHCCTGGAAYYVAVSAREQRRIQQHLGVSWRWFRRRYVVRFDDEIYSLRMDGGQCVFLDKARRCRIYSARPRQCRSYPFWPELAARGAWTAESRRCEGIGQGPDVGAKIIKIKRA